MEELPKRVARRARSLIERHIVGRRGLTIVPIGVVHEGGVIDGVELNDDGTLTLLGWGPDVNAFAEPLFLRGHGHDVPPTHIYGVSRPDVAKVFGGGGGRYGIALEFLLPAVWSDRQIEVMRGADTLAFVPVPSFSIPPYGGLYGNPGVLHREHIYGVGPPVHTVSSEVLDLCADLEGPLLDFGCGGGALLGRLRERGLDAQGLELDLPVMRDALLAHVRPHVCFYDGNFPAPFADGAFSSVTCCEVLEHIPLYREAIDELARLTRDRLLLTVPDASGIPRGFSHGVVPWHLLEGSHVNFFTQQSLAASLSPHFREVRFFRIGEIRCDRMRFYTSLVALCRR